MSQQQMAFIRETRRQPQPQPLDARDIDRESRAMWENIAEECGGERRGLAGIIARTYLLCRDIQRYASTGRVAYRTLLKVPEFIAATLARSYGHAAR